MKTYTASILALTIQLCQAVEVSLTWDPPTNNVDGTPVELGGYRIYWGGSSRTYSTNVTLPNVLTCTVTCADYAVSLLNGTQVVEAEQSAGWTASQHSPGWYGTNYLHDGNLGKGTKSVTFRPNLLASGQYEVSMWWPTQTSYYWASNAPVDICSITGTNMLLVNQQTNGSRWFVLGTNEFSAGTNGWVRVRTDNTTGTYVIADAVMFSQVGAAVTTRLSTLYFAATAYDSSVASNESDYSEELALVLEQPQPIIPLPPSDGTSYYNRKSGELTITWTRPTKNVDGTPYINAVCTLIQYGQQAGGPYTLSTNILPTLATAKVSIPPSSGYWYFVLASSNRLGAVSAYSPEWPSGSSVPRRPGNLAGEIK
jgi:hypothetical protein